MEEQLGQATRAADGACISPATSWRVTVGWLAVLTVVYLGVALPLLARVPRLVNDEVWTMTSGWTLAYEGRLRNPVIHNRNGIDRALIHPALAQSLVLGGTYRVLGFSVTSSRLASVLCGLLAVLGTYYLMRTWLTANAAGLIALLFATETQFFLFARVIRPEVYMTCLGVWMLALLARGTTRPRLWLCFAAGVVGAVACYTHPNMFIFAVLGVPLIVYQMGFRGRMLAALGCYVGGGIVGVAPYVVYVLWAQAHYDLNWYDQLGRYYTDAGDDSAQNVWRREVSRWDYYLQPLRRGPWVLLLALGALLGLVRRHPIQVWGLVLVLGHIVLMGLLIKSNAPRYLIPLGPWFAALVGLLGLAAWVWAGGRARGSLARWALRGVAGGAMAGALAVNVAGDAYVLYKYRHADYDFVCRRIATHIPPGARVYGNLLFWAGLAAHPYHSDINEDQVAAARLDATIRRWFVDFDPQYVVRSSDPCWGLGGFGPRPAEPQYAGFGVSTDFMSAKFKIESEFLRLRGDRLDAFYHPDFGTIEVWRIRR